MKLTMVSVWCRGLRTTQFVMLPIDADGKVRLPEANVRRLIGHIPPSITFGIGL